MTPSGRRPRPVSRLMTWQDHWAEGRSRLLAIILWASLATIVAIGVHERVLEGFIAQINAMVDAATPSSPSHLRTPVMVTLGVGEGLGLRIQVIMAMVIGLSLPVIVGQVVAYLTPLCPVQRARKLRRALIGALLILVGGIVIGYHLLPTMVTGIMALQPPGIGILWRPANLLAVSLGMMATLGVMGMLAYGLGWVIWTRAIPIQQIRPYLGIVVLCTLMVSALLTPTQDPLTMLIVASPVLIVVSGVAIDGYVSSHWRDPP